MAAAQGLRLRACLRARARSKDRAIRRGAGSRSDAAMGRCGRASRRARSLRSSDPSWATVLGTRTRAPRSSPSSSSARPRPQEGCGRRNPDRRSRAAQQRCPCCRRPSARWRGARAMRWLGAPFQRPCGAPGFGSRTRALRCPRRCTRRAGRCCCRHHGCDRATRRPAGEGPGSCAARELGQARGSLRWTSTRRAARWHGRRSPRPHAARARSRPRASRQRGRSSPRVAMRSPPGSCRSARRSRVARQKLQAVRRPPQWGSASVAWLASGLGSQEAAQGWRRQRCAASSVSPRGIALAHRPTARAVCSGSGGSQRCRNSIRSATRGPSLAPPAVTAVRMAEICGTLQFDARERRWSPRLTRRSRSVVFAAPFGRAVNSVGRVRSSQGRSRRFESCTAHQFPSDSQAFLRCFRGGAQVARRQASQQTSQPVCR